MRVLVTGAAGQLGGAVVETFAGRAEVVALDRAALDIRDQAAVSARVTAARPDVIVNCAAYNQVDEAEDDAEGALANNAFAVLALARAAADARATLVHYGTDFVFDGDASAPYSEEDSPNPLSTYGASKLLGDWFAADARLHYVLRVESLFGGRNKRSSIDRIVASLVAGKPTRVFVDRTVTPSYVYDVASATWTLLATRAEHGLYHCVNSGTTTWFDIANRAKQLLGAPGEIVQVRVADVQMRARRPQYCALSNEKLSRAGAEMPTWEEALERHLRSSIN